MKWVFAGLVGLIAVGVAWVLSYELQLRSPDYDDMVAKYSDPDSQFFDYDGTRIHYKDQGEGPAVFLWHGNWGDLSHYDGWVERHGESYRFIRMDIPAFGLSSLDSQVDYSIERRARIANALLDHLGVERYFIVGTSLAGPMAYRAAAEQPDRVIGLMLANAGGLPREVAINQPRPNPIDQWRFVHYKPKAFWDETVPGLFSQDDPVTPDRVQRFYELTNVKGRGPIGPIGLEQFDIGDAPGYLASITQPVLILWGGESILPFGEADRYWDFLSNAPKQMIKVQELGHMWMLDRPDLASDAFHAFAQSVLDGSFTPDAAPTPNPPSPDS